jgi:hypothetical protein
MEMESTITIRLPEDLKRQMDMYEINWSEELRKDISDRINALKMLSVLERMHKNSKSRKVKVDSTELIRQDRDTR